MERKQRRGKLALRLIFVLAMLAILAGGISACGPAGPSRSFYMGTTPFFTTPAVYPDWRMENLGDKDLLSVHADDFMGVPWVEFRDDLPLPSAWVSKWTDLATQAQATGKTIYLAVSPLGGRRTLAPKVDSSRVGPRWTPMAVIRSRPTVARPATRPPI
jgi:hypothetical protein